MPCCPNCSKGGFKDHVAVRNHMSQPPSGCNTWVDDIVSLWDYLQVSSSLAPVALYPTPSSQDSNQPALENNMDVNIGPPPLANSEQYLLVKEVPPAHHKMGPQETCEHFPGAAWISSMGLTFMDNLDVDQYSSCCNANLYYPFNSLPFTTAKDLCGKVELLPSRPCWHVVELKPSHPTKQCVYLYWCDSLECITWLLHNALFCSHLNWTPQCIYTEWMTGDKVWNMQVCSHPSLQCMTCLSD